MASTIKSDNGVSSGVTGIVQTADSTGQLALQTTTSGGTATTAITIDNSQNVGVGVTPSAWGSSSAIDITSWSSIGTIPGNGSTVITNNAYYNSSGIPKYKISTFNAASYAQSTSGVHTWSIAGTGTAGNAITFTQAMTLDNSGNLLVGQTATGARNSNSQSLEPANGYGVFNHINGTASGVGYIYFGYNGSSIASITQNGTTGVLYNTTSDYRLKNNPVPVTGAKDFVMALQPKTWDWWDGSGKGVGFIAHEFMEVAKYSGHGEKDAVDADGKPVYQSIQPSSSEIMANLVAYIQELSAEVTALKAKVGV